MALGTNHPETSWLRQLKTVWKMHYVSDNINLEEMASIENTIKKNFKTAPVVLKELGKWAKHYDETGSIN